MFTWLAFVYYVCISQWYHLSRSIGLQGPLAFYKGFIPNFGRLGSWNVIMFLTLEQVWVGYFVIAFESSSITFCHTLSHGFLDYFITYNVCCSRVQKIQNLQKQFSSSVSRWLRYWQWFEKHVWQNWIKIKNVSLLRVTLLKRNILLNWPTLKMRPKYIYSLYSMIVFTLLLCFVGLS